MGEIADDMISGRCCSLCGQYFIEAEVDDNQESAEGTLFEHGYPVACNECWEPDCGYQQQSNQAFIL